MTRSKKPCEKFIVRFAQVGLRHQIAELAKASNRSMNAEILHRLFRSLELEEELRRANAVIDRLTASAPDNKERPS
ncbi:Arc family DNA-binding protein [Pseudomonas sp. v388]|uniref:Arc family DNA-binding protein n=1 Tax=Pseudomonas sp. v388 TaxID=2479849 RepID=UPI000F76AAC8|nr:Arc family DNA-binding protein [Pseudomonas sp. v388]RRV04569.1 Arc family DNA-binding protein [Pseudomonas sp. v388]